MSFTSRLLSDIPGIRYAFLDVHETAAFPYSEMAPVKLVHSNIVHEYRAPQAERPHADAMFTAVSGQKMGVVTADCLPLLMASRDGRYVCSVHAGWRGAASGIIDTSILDEPEDPSWRGNAREQRILAQQIHFRALALGDIRQLLFHQMQLR